MSAAIKPLGAALLGARGYVGAELIALLEDHPALELVAASSRAMEGQPVKGVLDDAQRRGLGVALRRPAPTGGRLAAPPLAEHEPLRGGLARHRRRRAGLR